MTYEAHKPKLSKRSRSVSPRLRYLTIRIIQVVPTLLLVVLFSFVLLHLAPGDPAQVLAGEAGGATPEYLSQLRVSYGLDKPVYVQFFLYVQNVCRGNLGFSFRANMPVLELIAARLTPTLLLAGASLIIAISVGLLAGAIAALYRGKTIDILISNTALVIYATPSFLLGIGLIVLLSLKLELLPTGGYVDASSDAGWVAHLSSLMKHLVMPAVALGAFYAAIYARFVRAAMLEVYTHQHVRGARARGLSHFQIAIRHVLRNSLLPFVTLVGLQAGSILSGAILVETVFAWPGLGRLAYEAMQQRDYNLLSGLVLCSGLVVMAVNVAVDAVYAVLDPRIELR